MLDLTFDYKRYILTYYRFKKTQKSNLIDLDKQTILFSLFHFRDISFLFFIPFLSQELLK